MLGSYSPKGKAVSGPKAKAKVSRDQTAITTSNANSVSKRSMVEAGYMEDPFVFEFAEPKGRRPPLIHRGYWIRSVAVDIVTKWFLDAFAQKKPSQILSLGAGFDTLFFRLFDAGELPSNGFRFYEVDFAETVEHKRRIMRSSSRLEHFLQTSSEQASATAPLFIMASSDLRNVDALEASLLNADVPFDFQRPTLVLAEVALVYLPAHAADAVIGWVASNIPTAVFAAYEQIVPFDGFGTMMCSHFDSIGSSLHCAKEYPTLQAVVDRHVRLDLRPICALDLNSLLVGLPREVCQRSFDLEPFDEFEEWHLKCGHYALVCSRSSSCSCSLEHVVAQLPKSARLETLPLKEVPVQTIASAVCERFGHAGCLISSRIAFVFGGSGPDSRRRHGRRSSISIFDLATGQVREKEFQALQDCMGMYAAVAPVTLASGLTRGAVILGGRAAPLPSRDALPLSATIVEIPSDIFDGLADQDSLNTRLLEFDAEAPTTRWRHSAVTLRNCLDVILVFGGRNATTVFSELWALHVESQRWERFETSTSICPCARHSHAAVAIESDVFSISGDAAEEWVSVMLMSGGIDQHENPLDDIFVLEQETHHMEFRWRQLHLQGLLPRFGHTIHIWQDFVVLVGGVSPSVLGAEGPLEWWRVLSDKSSERFRLVANLAGICDGLFLTFNHCSMLVNESIVLLGGGGSCFSFGIHVNSHALSISLPEILGSETT